MNLDFKFSSNGSSKMDMESLVHLSGKIWKKGRTVLFFVLLAASMGGGAFIWQGSLSGAGWNDQRKQEFMDSQNKNVEFKQQAYQKVIDQIEQRQNENSSEYQNIKDIFKAY